VRFHPNTGTGEVKHEIDAGVRAGHGQCDGCFCAISCSGRGAGFGSERRGGDPPVGPDRISSKRKPRHSFGWGFSFARATPEKATFCDLHHTLRRARPPIVAPKKKSGGSNRWRDGSCMHTLGIGSIMIPWPSRSSWSVWALLTCWCSAFESALGSRSRPRALSGVRLIAGRRASRTGRNSDAREPLSFFSLGEVQTMRASSSPASAAMTASFAMRPKSQCIRGPSRRFRKVARRGEMYAAPGRPSNGRSGPNRQRQRLRASAHAARRRISGDNETLRDEHHRYSSQIFIASPFIGGSHAQAHQFYNRCHNSRFGYSFLGQSQRARKQCEG
jgi:hypothetical protein